MIYKADFKKRILFLPNGRSKRQGTSQDRSGGQELYREDGVTSGAITPREERDFSVSSPQEIAHTHAGYDLGKRCIDVAGAFAGLFFFSFFFLILAVLVVVASPGPIFHRRRVLSWQPGYMYGTRPRTFDAFKFRTMIVNADDYLARNPKLREEFEKDYKLKEDPRVTKIGHHLRRLSLDELPQLINVLRGQMSLVGPRMISPPELIMYGEYGKKLLAVKPGLTGLWQVSGRQNVSYAERVRLDMHYIDNRSLVMDIQILLKTVACVLKRRGAY
jgi:lipopolysaccharide/colanic/teichoic acid biosynthesis glycosyltransferase